MDSGAEEGVWCLDVAHQVYDNVSKENGDTGLMVGYKHFQELE